MEFHSSHPGGWKQKLKASQALLLSVAHQTLGEITVGGMHNGVKSPLDYRWHMEFYNNWENNFLILLSSDTKIQE